MYITQYNIEENIRILLPKFRNNLGMRGLILEKEKYILIRKKLSLR